MVYQNSVFTEWEKRAKKGAKLHKFSKPYLNEIRFFIYYL